MAAPLIEITTILREMLCDSGLEIAPATRFDELTGWDSMDLVAVVVEVECQFNLHFELAEIERMISVADLLEMIAAKQALASA